MSTLLLAQGSDVFILTTPKGFANASPAVGAQRQPWVQTKVLLSTPEGVHQAGETPSGFATLSTLQAPGLKQPWAGISEPLRGS